VVFPDVKKKKWGKGGGKPEADGGKREPLKEGAKMKSRAFVQGINQAKETGPRTVVADNRSRYTREKGAKNP